jgi:SAM-dependent methyltransferase
VADIDTRVDEPAFEVPEDWYHSAFEQDWLDEIALHIEPERTTTEAEFLIEQLELAHDSRILDLACGHGRIALELARLGYSLTGLDLSPRSIALAREASAREGLEVEWTEADMRELPAGREFDAIFNVFTAFGYFAEENENQRVLEGVARALVPGGRFLIETMNLLWLAGIWQPRIWEALPGGGVQLSEHEYDVLRGRNRARWIFIRPDGSRGEHVHSLRTYTPHELASMLERAGLQIEKSFGAMDGSPLELRSRRIVLVARKPQ